MGNGSREGKRRKWVSVNCCVVVVGFQGRNKVGAFDPRPSIDFATAPICNNCWIERSKSVLFRGFGEATKIGEGVAASIVWSW